MLAFPLSHNPVKHILRALTLVMRSEAVFVHVWKDAVNVDSPAGLDIVAGIDEYGTDQAFDYIAKDLEISLRPAGTQGSTYVTMGNVIPPLFADIAERIDAT